MTSLTGISPGGSGILVASSDAPGTVKARADFVCDGVNDEVQVTAAIAAADTGFFNGKSVTLSAGTFVFGSDVAVIGDLVSIQGSGRGNQGNAKNTTITSATGYAGSLFTQHGAELYLSDLYLTTDDTGPSGSTGLVMCDASSGGSNSLIATNVYVENDYGVAVVSHGATGNYNRLYLDNCDFEGDSGGLLGNYLTTLNATNCQFYAYSSGYGLDINESAQNDRNSRLDHCYCEGPGGMRFVVKTGGGSVQATNMLWFGFDSLPAVYVGNANHVVYPNILSGGCLGDTAHATDLVTLSACAHLTYDLSGINSGGHGLHLASCSDTQGSWMMLDASAATDNTYSGLILDGTGARNSVGPVHIRTTAANKALYGVRVAAGTITNTFVHEAELVGASKTAGNEFSDAGTGTVVDIPVPAGATRGDVVFYNGTSWQRLAAGTSGYVLQTNGSGADPTWVSGGGGGGGSVPFTSAVRTAGDVSLTATSVTAVDTGLDLTLAAATGDVIEFGIAGLVAAGTAFKGFEVYTMPGGTKTNPFGIGIDASLATLNGVPSWICDTSSQSRPLTGSITRTLLSGDISGGNVVLRLYYAGTSGTARALNASASTPLYVWAKNLRH